MTRYQICLVSAQAAANLLPALDPALKPEQAILLVSKKMQPRATALTAVLREADVQTRSVELDDEHDYARLIDQMLELASELDGSSVTLNVTGGTKLMALAAQEVALSSDWKVFYVDADTDQVIWLSDPRTIQPLDQRLRLRHYLAGYGFSIGGRIETPQVNPAHQDLLRTLIAQIGSMTRALAQMNWLAQQAENQGTLRIQLDEHQRDSRSLEVLLRNLADAGLIRNETNHIVFTGAEDRSLIKGGWLEQVVFQTVARLSVEIGIRDKACNLEVTDATGVKNELDVAFLARNRLHVIECKTARMDQPVAPKANDTLFKLAEIGRRVGGLNTRRMLVSYRKLGDSERRLARALNIEVVSGVEIQVLEARLRTWVSA